MTIQWIIFSQLPIPSASLDREAKQGEAGKPVSEGEIQR
jgi:hypothetical protein